jgi:hypothetical protein
MARLSQGRADEITASVADGRVNINRLVVEVIEAKIEVCGFDGWADALAG